MNEHKISKKEAITHYIKNWILKGESTDSSIDSIFRQGMSFNDDLRMVVGVILDVGNWHYTDAPEGYKLVESITKEIIEKANIRRGQYEYVSINGGEPLGVYHKLTGITPIQLSTIVDYLAQSKYQLRKEVMDEYKEYLDRVKKVESRNTIRNLNA